jgi:hypothetical protein
MIYGETMAKKKMQLIILVSDEAVKELQRQRANSKNYNKVVLSLMKNADFDLRMLGDLDVNMFPPLNLNKSFADIEASGTQEDVVEGEEVAYEEEMVEESEVAQVEETQLEKAVRRTSWTMRR